MRLSSGPCRSTLRRPRRRLRSDDQCGRLAALGARALRRARASHRHVRCSGCMTSRASVQASTEIWPTRPVHAREAARRSLVRAALPASRRTIRAARPGQSSIRHGPAALLSARHAHGSPHDRRRARHPVLARASRLWSSVLINGRTAHPSVQEGLSALARTFREEGDDRCR